MAFFVVITTAVADTEQTPFPEKFGIGATLIQRDSTSAVVVGACMPGGPASQAGIMAGDTFIALDDTSVEGWGVPRIIDYILCDEPLPLALTVRRGSQGLSFAVMRARMSDIAAGADLRIVPNVDSTNYQLVPLHELQPLRRGDNVGSFDVFSVDCSEAKLVLKGDRPTLVYFWATWCGPCKTFIRWLDEQKGRAKHPNVRFVGINVDRECSIFTDAVDSLSPVGDQYWDGGIHGELSQRLRAHRRGIPTGALIGAGGAVLQITTGVDSLIALVPSQKE
jgi:thiol-disulfide isomerase/thioredoxin